MNANKQIKVNVVKEISKKLSDAKGIVVAKYDGLSVKEFQSLRSQLKEKNVELKVYKNRLFKIAAKEAGLGELEPTLTGANVFAFGMSDDISPSKILAAFAKEHSALELKGGTFEGKVVDAVGINEVATLPSFEEALSMLAMQLISPVKFVGVGLNQLVEEGHIKGDATSSAKPANETKEAAPVEETKAEENKEETPTEEVVEKKEGE